MRNPDDAAEAEAYLRRNPTAFGRSREPRPRAEPALARPAADHERGDRVVRPAHCHQASGLAAGLPRRGRGDVHAVLQGLPRPRGQAVQAGRRTGRLVVPSGTSSRRSNTVVPRCGSMTRCTAAMRTAPRPSAAWSNTSARFCPSSPAASGGKCPRKTAARSPASSRMACRSGQFATLSGPRTTHPRRASHVCRSAPARSPGHVGRPGPLPGPQPRPEIPEAARTRRPLVQEVRREPGNRRPVVHGRRGRRLTTDGSRLGG